MRAPETSGEVRGRIGWRLIATRMVTILLYCYNSDVYKIVFMSKKKNTKSVLDKFHYHEVLDRCFCVQNIIEDLLLDHPAIEQNKKWHDKIEKAQKLIGEVYQDIGNI